MTRVKCADTVLVDVGGTYFKTARLSERFQPVNARIVPIKSFGQIILEIKKQNKDLNRIVISAPGHLSADKKVVEYCHSLPWLQGDIEARLRNGLGNKYLEVIMMPDSDAHVHYFLANKQISNSALVLAIGTAVATGLVDSQGHITSNLSGSGWDINQLILSEYGSNETQYTKKAMAGALISGKNLSRLRETYGDGVAYRIFANYVADLLSQMIIIFAPKSICLSGGVVAYHWVYLQENVLQQLKGTVGAHSTPAIVVSVHKETPLRGLASYIRLYDERKFQD